jgi:RecB family exonuclease
MFLQQLANAYIKNEVADLANFCFVFPNKRSAIFFKNYLKNRLIETKNDNDTVFLPSLTTISSFINQFVDTIEASRTELLFTLYNTYIEITHEKSYEFDNFRYWGEMLLNDFNDIDRYLINAHDLYKNIVDFKDIKSNHLTKNQVKTINHYFGKGEPVTYNDDKLWASSTGSNNPETKYLNNCRILEKLYNEFRKRLTSKGYHYSGMAYRRVAENIKDFELSHTRYIFVGFNVLSKSEKAIFSYLRDHNLADFYWDFCSPSFFRKEVPSSMKQIKREDINTNNKATLFMKDNIFNYPSKYDIPIQNDSQPEIEVISVASSSGQTKIVNSIIKDFINNNDIHNCTDALNTAIVLPDESLFIPTLHCIPSEISAINVTMGLPMKYTSISTLMSAIFKLHKNIKIIRSRAFFYYEYMLDILSHPYIQAILPEQSNMLRKDIMSHNKFNIDIEELVNDSKYNQFNIIFDLAKEDNNVYLFVKNILDWIKNAFESNNFDASSDKDIQLLYINNYIEELQTIHSLCSSYKIDMKQSTFFNLIESIINTKSIPLEGKPLKGLQIMGVLETRALDFENLVVLSMNERIYPRKSYTKTYIPNRLRSALDMATVNDQESIYAYYFYRMISRAKKVKLLYDSRIGGTNNGEMSRYIYQLKYIYPQNVKFTAINYVQSRNKSREISIQKDKAELQQFLQGGTRTISASSLKTYKKCPLLFYFQVVKGLTEDDQMQDYVDAITFGNIVHRVVEQFYKEKAKGISLTEIKLDELKRNPRLKILIKEAINSLYYRQPENKCQSELTGEAKIIGEVVEMIIKKMIDCEKQNSPFEFIDAEHKVNNIEWPITDEITIRFKMIIDRIDQFYDGNQTKIYRFIDYKTGNDSVKFSSVDSLFNSSDYDAIFQLLLYCEAFAYHNKTQIDIQPYIYKLRTLYTTGLSPIFYGSKPLLNYKDVHDEFWNNFKELIAELFNYSKPYSQAPEGSDCCNYCQFNTMCGRQVKLK